MNLLDKIKKVYGAKHAKPKYGALDLFKYIGPGLLVTVGFIDPGNCRVGIWLYAFVGSELIHNHAYYSSAQCSPSGYYNRIVSF